jgi:peptide/nickel transport system substrate-binding protein
MDQGEVLRVLIRKLDEGTITRRQFMKAASLFGVAGAASAFLAACGPSTTPSPAVGPGASPSPVGPTTSAAAAAPTGSVRFLVAETFWADWHPYQTSAQIAYRIEQNIFDRLVEVETDDPGQLSPGLATSWNRLDDQTWEFKLREGVRFHDGQEFTAEDVKASIELGSGATPVQTVLAGYMVPTTAEVVDKLTVRVKSSEPFSPLLGLLAWYGVNILSKADIDAGEEKIKSAPNGTGPFRLVKDEKDRKTMEAFTDHWRGAPKIKELIWEFIQDPQTRLSALLAGQATVIDRVPPEHLVLLGGSPDISLVSKTGMENVTLHMNPNPEAPWVDKNFRKAVAWSFDREALVRDLILGSSQVATSFIPQLALFHVDGDPQYTQDIDRAKEFLAQSRYADGGPEFELWAATGFQPRAKEVVEVIEDGMRQVGMRPKIVLSDVAGLIDKIFIHEGQPYRMFHLSWSSNGDPDTAQRFLYKSPGVWSDGDPKVDELIVKGAAATDDQERATIYAELQQYQWDQVLHVPLYYPDFTIAHSKRLTGLRVQPTFATYFYDTSLAS